MRVVLFACFPHETNATVALARAGKGAGERSIRQRNAPGQVAYLLVCTLL